MQVTLQVALVMHIRLTMGSTESNSEVSSDQMIPPHQHQIFENLCPPLASKKGVAPPPDSIWLLVNCLEFCVVQCVLTANKDKNKKLMYKQ